MVDKDGNAFVAPPEVPGEDSPAPFVVIFEMVVFVVVGKEIPSEDL